MANFTLHTPLCDLLGIKYPILLAGMGAWGMATPPELVAAVSNAGGAGILGCSGLSPQEIRRRIVKTRELTDKPFGVDLLLPARLATAATTRSGVRAELIEKYPQHVDFVAKLHTHFALEQTPVQDDIVISSDFINKQISVLLDEKVPIFAAGLGNPVQLLSEARKIGMVVMGLAGSSRNAMRHLESGVDIIICQGTEAGGHTGAIATLPLLAETLEKVSPVPVLAAGGIVDGRGVAAALTMGAVGVWIGTAFLVANESGIPNELKDAILTGEATDFQISRSWTGKTLRSQKNAVTEAWANSNLDSLPTPHQRVLMEDFLEAAKKAERWDLFMNAAGQGSGLLRKRRPASEIMSELVEKTIQILEDIPKKIRFEKM